MKQFIHQILNQTIELDTVYSMNINWNIHSSHQQMHIWHIAPTRFGIIYAFLGNSIPTFKNY